MKNSRITYHKERTRREFKYMIAVQRNLREIHNPDRFFLNDI